MRLKITYDGNDQETYNLYLNGNKHKELRTGEDQVIGIVKDLQKYVDKVLDTYDPLDQEILIQILTDDESVSINILDDDDNHIEGGTFFFDEY